MHLQWFRNYLGNRKQYIQIDGWQKANYKTVKRGVPQGSILGPSLFLLYINDLQFPTDILDPSMFADDTNLFYSNKDINTVFLKVNDELQKINEWFICNKLSLDVKKNKKKQILAFPQTYQKRYSTSLTKTEYCEIARTESIKFLGVLLDENLSWKTHKVHRK